MQLSELLSKDLSNWDIRTKSGMLGRQNAAKIRIEEVKKDLAYFILKNSVTVLLMRDYEQTNTVVESAKKNPEANIVLDALMIEKKMFQNLFGTAKTLTFNSDIVSRMNILMSEVGLKIEAASLPVILGDARHFGTLRTRGEMIERMERVIWETYAEELKSHFFRAVILDEVAARIATRDSINVVIVNVPQNLVRAFSSYTGRTQILSNESQEAAQLTRPERRAAAQTVEAAPVEAQAQPQVQTQAVVQQITAEQTQAEAKKPYTGARRGRKTNAERAALATQKTTENQG